MAAKKGCYLLFDPGACQGGYPMLGVRGFSCYCAAALPAGTAGVQVAGEEGIWGLRAADVQRLCIPPWQAWWGSRPDNEG